MLVFAPALEYAMSVRLPLLSVVMAVKNGEQTLAEALTALAGRALIRAMQRYQAGRQAEQQQPQDDRRNRIRAR